jgi:hypothetical protein
MPAIVPQALLVFGAVLVAIGILFGARTAAALFLICVAAAGVGIYQLVANLDHQHQVAAAKAAADQKAKLCGHVWDAPPKDLRPGDIVICDNGKWRIDASARPTPDFVHDPAYSWLDGNVHHKRNQ